ncbi:hypothetical protein RGQ13_12695 [Thalassotalea psychrophila]|uniref:Big-1 domain-containing protein n=1 Tax=Thalassotalea psychrophila TaxID=3065647 RepID=A0ABY9TQ84_9GAMM|nr:hypothetical protein RGQ13_12695 [Colwelliaceae bacterium SQ149]
MMKKFQHFFYLFLLVFLTACDGDSFTAEDKDEVNPLESTTTIELTIDNTYVDAATPATVTAKVQTDGVAVDNIVVTFSSEVGLFDIESSTALTNSDGIATIGLTAGAIEGAGTITASIESGEIGTIGFESAGDGIDPDASQNQGESENVVLVNMSISARQVAALSAQIITANISDLDGPVEGTVVAFSTTSGYLLPSSGSALTNSNGNATIIINADNVEGAGTVTATAPNGESATISFSNAGDGGVIAGKQVKLSLSNNQVSSASPATVMVTVTDENGAVAGEVVNFSSSIGVLNPYSGTALTDATGAATITLTAGNVEGAGLVSATLATGEFDSLGFSTSGDASEVAGNEVSLTISTTSITDGSPSMLTATVTNSGNPVGGEVVNFSSTLGTLSPASGTALTNASGQAVITLSAGTNAGAGVASVTLDNGANAKVGFETAGDASAKLGKTIVVTPITDLVEKLAPVTIMVKVTDNGVDVANEVISFTTTLGAFNPLSGTALTNSTGNAIIELTAGSIEGAGIVTASLASGETDTSGFATKGDGDGITDKVIELDAIVGTISNAAPVIVWVTVTENERPSASEVVNFSSSLGVFDPVSATALTDTDGRAFIELSAGDIKGAGIVTATLTSGELDTTGFATDGDAPAILGKEVAVNVLTKNIIGTATSIVEATVTENGALVANEFVNFAATLGLLDPRNGTALTDGDGVASVTLSAGTVKGAGIVTATLSNGAKGNDTFTTAGDEVLGIYLDVILVEPDTINPIDTINTTTPGQLIATVNGLGVGEKVLVTFSSDIGEISIPTAITDVNNQAIVDIYAGNDIGAGTITASLVSGETGSALVVVGAAGLQMQTPVVGLSPISAGGSTNISVTIIDTNNGNAPYTEPVLVNFSSSCSLDGKAQLDEQVSTFQGTAVSSYLAQGCTGNDIITVTANAGTESLTATAAIDVEAAAIGSIIFESATPENISLKGIGGEESSTVIFQVLDENSNPVSGEQVSFELNTVVGGVSLNPNVATTNSNGYAQTVINSGTVSTTVRVTATVDNTTPNISSQSNKLVISTGIPDQDSFSISAETLNLERIYGNQTTITARMADAFNNPVPDGTSVYFTTEGGLIVGDCQTADSACSVTFTVQDPIPSGNTVEEPSVNWVKGDDESLFPSVINLMGQNYGGRITILATAIGEESFADTNGNGLFDVDEHPLFDTGFDTSGDDYDMPEAFIDYNEDSVFNPAGGGEAGGDSEEFADFDVSGDYNSRDNKYTGVLCAEDAKLADLCSPVQSLNVRDSLVLIVASPRAYAVRGQTIDALDADNALLADDDDKTVNIVGEDTGHASIIISDVHNQPMPKGTIIEFTSTVGSIVGPDTFTWSNDNHNGGQEFSVSIKGEDEAKSGSLIVQITTPGGTTTTKTLIDVAILAVAVVP